MRASRGPCGQMLTQGGVEPPLYMVSPRYARPEQRKDYRNGYYTRDFVTRFGTLRLRIARTRKRGFLPEVMKKFQRRAEEVALLIREAFLRGISTRQVGRVVATFTGERVSPQTVSRITQELDQAVRQFHQARLEDDWAYLFLDGVSLRVRRPVGRKRVQMLVAYRVKRDGRRELLAFLRTRGESQADWESLLQDLFRRGLEGKHLQMIVTDGCPGLGAAIQTVYSRALHQRCWVHKMRNILEKVKKRDYEQVKADAQAIYRAENRKQIPGGWPALLPTLATELSQPGATTGTRPAGTAVVLRLTPATVEEVTNH
jgi:putative transposase